MTRHLLLPLCIALAACAPKSDRVDSADAALPAIDTLKPVTASDTLAGTAGSTAAAPTPPATKGTAPTKSTGAAATKTTTKLGRDSAFPPPRGLPKLDTVPTKRPPR